MKHILFDTSKLRGRLVEKGKTQKDLAEYLDITEAALCRKMKSGVNFKQGEILQTAEFLDIPMDQLTPYFFTVRVQ